MVQVAPFFSGKEPLPEGFTEDSLMKYYHEQRLRAIVRRWQAELAKVEPFLDGGPYLQALRDCVTHLEGRERRAIELRYDEQVSRETMAQALQLTPEGVKAMLRRVRSKLRMCVEGKLGETQ